MVTTERSKSTLVDNLMPGNKMDVQVAVSCMHWRYMPIQAGKVSAVEWAEWIDLKGQTQAAGTNGGFHPSTNNQDADRILDNWQSDVIIKRQNGFWIATFFIPSEEFESVSGVRQVAICRAALKSAGISKVG